MRIEAWIVAIYDEDEASVWTRFCGNSINVSMMAEAKVFGVFENRDQADKELKMHQGASLWKYESESTCVRASE